MTSASITSTQQNAGQAHSTNNSPYDRNFYDVIRDGSRRSARALAPIILGLTDAQSVVDVGCGDGTWLSVFRECGVKEVLGLDGEYVDSSRLQIPKEQFRPVNLAKPFTADRSFDLAVTLEVAEHLPPESAASFVSSLVALAPIVLFSAAIPFQGGTRHLNEQWPDYWSDLFAKHDYLLIDCIRPKLWHNDEVEWWYCQNSFVYASAKSINTHSVLRAAYEATNVHQLRLVHPRKYLYATRVRGVKEAWNEFVSACQRATRKRLGKAQ